MQIPADVLNWLSIDSSSANWTSLGNHGGYSGAQFWKSSGGADNLCLRCWPRQHPTPERLKRIHRWLRIVGDSGLDCVPVPRSGIDGRTWCENQLGRWECSPWKDGNADFEKQPTEERLASAADCLAQFHLALSGEQQSPQARPPCINERISLFEQLWKTDLAALQRQAPLEHDHSLRQLAARTLHGFERHNESLYKQLQQFQSISIPLQPCIRDIWHDHVLFTGNRVTGLVDFGAMRIDAVATDLARLFGSLAQDNNELWSAARTAYDLRNKLSADHWILARVLDRSGCLLGAINWLRWLWLEEKSFESPERALSRLTQLVSRVDRWGELPPQFSSLTV